MLWRMCAATTMRLCWPTLSAGNSQQGQACDESRSDSVVHHTSMLAAAHMRHTVDGAYIMLALHLLPLL
jgi:hypothetical protein